MTDLKIRALALPAAAVVLTVGLAGCGGNEDSAGNKVAAGSTGAEPANPIPILQNIDGCELEAGAATGETDIDGNRYATCAFPDGTSVVARTYPGDPTELATAEQLRSDDSSKVIAGEYFTVVMTGEFTGEYATEIDPDQVAAQVGGEYLAPS